MIPSRSIARCALLLTVAFASFGWLATVRADTPLESWRRELLDLAWNGVREVPLRPHVKTRARLAESVVDAALALEQPAVALQLAEQIETWRRGTATASCARNAAERGDAAEARRLIDLALAVAANPPAQETQEWQRDRILSIVAQALVLLGDESAAAKIEISLSESESGRSGVALAARVTAEALDAQLILLDPVLATGTLDQLRHAVATLLALHRRFRDDPAHCAAIEQRLETALPKLPLDVRVGFLLERSAADVERAELPAALARLDEAARAIDSTRWSSDLLVPMLARIAAARHHAGDTARARLDLDAALVRFHAERTRINDIDRCDALLPVAEAYAELRDPAAALVVYRLAAEAAVENPNSRPRADDLVPLCLSLARHDVAPDAPFLALIRSHFQQMGDPW